MKNIIEVENITKKYGSFVAVDNISFEGEEGDVIAFLGPNGAGKTTTMRMLTCYMPSTSGTARIDGYDIFYDSFKVRERIGYAPEMPPVYPDMTVNSYLKYVAEIKQVPAREITAKVDKVVEQCGLSEMRKKLISKLSRGYRQRTGIAQAIIHDPKVIILDEPTVGLDPNQVIEVREVIKQLSENKTVMISTHILSEAEAICKHVIIIDKGKIVGKGTWQQLQKDLQELVVTRIKLVDYTPQKLELIKDIDGVDSFELLKDNQIKVFSRPEIDIKPQLIRLLSDQGWGFDEIASEKMSLEQIFKRLTDKKKV